MDDTTIDLQELLQILDSHKKIIAAVTAGFVLCSGLYLFVVSPTYESVSLLRVKQTQGLSDSILSSLPAGSSADMQQKMSTDAEILQSRSVVIPVIQATEQPDSSGKYPEYDGYVKGHITTVPLKNTEILQVSVTGKTPAQAQAANQMLVQGLLKRLADMSHDEQKATRQFLQQRLTAVKQELTQAEDALQNYQVANQMYSPSDQMKTLSDQLSTVDKAKAENQLDLETAKAALGSVTGQLDSAGKSVADSPAIQQYKVQLAQLETTKAGYVGKYTDDNPKMQEINSQIQTVRGSLDQEISRIVEQQAPSTNAVQQGLLTDKFKNEAAIAVAEGKEKALASLDAQNNASIAALPEKEQGFIRVKRDADVSQEIYVMLSKRLEEAKIAEVMVPNEVQIVDNATLPEQPIKPLKSLTLILSLILGLLAGSGFVITQNLLNRRIRTSEDVEQQFGLPVLGMIPDAHTVKEESSQSWIDKLRRRLWRKSN